MMDGVLANKTEGRFPRAVELVIAPELFVNCPSGTGEKVRIEIHPDGNTLVQDRASAEYTLMHRHWADVEASQIWVVDASEIQGLSIAGGRSFPPRSGVMVKPFGVALKS